MAGYATGESEIRPERLQFYRSVKLEFRGSAISSDGGLLLFRERSDLPGRWIVAVHDRRPPKAISLDMDSSESPVHGYQEGAAWNGHFQSKCLHPLFVFNQFGDLERSALRPGSVHSADGWEEVLKPVPARYAPDAMPSFSWPKPRFREPSSPASSP